MGERQEAGTQRAREPVGLPRSVEQIMGKQSLSRKEEGLDAGQGGGGGGGEKFPFASLPTCNLGSELSQVSLRPKPELNPVDRGRTGRSGLPWISSPTFPTLLSQALTDNQVWLGPLEQVVGPCRHFDLQVPAASLLLSPRAEPC